MDDWVHPPGSGAMFRRGDPRLKGFDMPDNHDTNNHAPVGSVKCSDHETCFKDVYDKMCSKTYVGVLCFVAMAFAGFLWLTTHGGNEAQDKQIRANEMRVEKINTHLEYVRRDQQDIKSEQMKLSDKLDRALRILEKRNP